VRPWVTKQGDFILHLANTFGFDADTVWQDPSNAQLRAIRPNPNLLAPGDVLSIPDPPTQPPPMTSLTPGSTNRFVAPDPPTMTLTHKFVGFDATTYASKAYTVQELDQLTGLQSDENGVVTFQAPVTLKTATVSSPRQENPGRLASARWTPSTRSPAFSCDSRVSVTSTPASRTMRMSPRTILVLCAPGSSFSKRRKRAAGVGAFSDGDSAAPASAPSGPASSPPLQFG
jgi:hypothetical protein